MKAYIVGNNLTMIAGMHGSNTTNHRSTCGSYIPSSAYAAALQLIVAVEEALKLRLVDEHGSILMIMPTKYSGAKSLLHIGFKPTWEGKNPNSGNKCYHFVESVETCLTIAKQFIERKMEEFSRKERNVLFTSFVSYNYVPCDLIEESKRLIKVCDDILSGEDENK